MLNKALIIGNLGKDPEEASTKSGTAVAKFSVASKETWKDKSGEKQEHTEWHNCIAYGRLAEVIVSYLTKGALVYLEGKIQTRKWEDKEGNTRYSTEILVNEMKMLGGKKADRGEREEREERAPAKAKQVKNEDDLTDDIPF